MSQINKKKDVCFMDSWFCQPKSDATSDENIELQKSLDEISARLAMKEKECSTLQATLCQSEKLLKLKENPKAGSDIDHAHAVKDEESIMSKEKYSDARTDADLVSARSEIVELKQSLFDIQARLVFVENEKSALQTDLADTSQDNNKLQVSLSEISSSLAQKDSEIQVLQQSLAEATANLAAKQEVLAKIQQSAVDDDSKDKEIAALKVSLFGKESEIVGLKQTLSETYARVATIEKEKTISMDKSESALAAKNKEIESLKQQLESSNIRFVATEKELAGLQQANYACDAASKKEKADLQQALVEKSAQNEEKTAENLQLQKRLQSFNEVNARQRKEQEVLQGLLAERDAQNTALQQRVEVIAGENMWLQQRITAVNADLAMAHQQLTECEPQQQQQNFQQNFQKELEESQLENQALKQQIKESAKETHELQQQLTDTTALLAAKEKELHVYTDKEALQKFVAEKFATPRGKNSKKSQSSKKGATASASVADKGSSMTISMPSDPSNAGVAAAAAPPLVEEKMDFGGKTFSLKMLPAKR